MINLKQCVPSGCKVIVHWMPWHGSSGHVPLLYPMGLSLPATLIPYVSSDSAICADQVAKMKMWGVDAINVDYYGPGNAPLESATLAMLAACAAGGLGFSVCVDQGAISAGADATDQYIEVLSFLGGGMMASPAYLRDSTGRSIVSFFGEPAGVDWNAVRAAIPSPMAFLFEANFAHLQADGAFGWVNPVAGQPLNIDIPAIQTFNASATANPTKMAWFPAYAGFDDSIASWGSGRVMVRGCGKTLLDTLAQVPKTAEYVLLPTWNDCEEGTNLEEGVSVANP